MTKISDVVNYLETIAPTSTQEEWDNGGKQVFYDNDLKKILVAMDLKDTTVATAIKEGVNLIITHHPVFFDPLKSIDTTNYKGKLIDELMKNEISVYSTHTAMDVAEEGVNKAFAEKLEIKNYEGLVEVKDGLYLGGIGDVPDYSKKSLTVFIINLKKLIKPEFLKIYGRVNERIEKIAWCGGSGADFIKVAKEKGADLYITGDVSYHEGQRAYEEGLTVIDIGHFSSEKPILQKIKKLIEEKFDAEVILVEENSFLISAE